jgi:hypothetical protein
MTKRDTLIQMAKLLESGDWRMRPKSLDAYRWAKAVLESWSGAPFLYLTVYREQSSWLALMVAEEFKWSNP